MQWCSAAGIPHSRFLRWSADDRAKQMAYLLEEAERCAMCGTAEHEWDANHRAYLPVVRFCPGCYARASMAEDTAGHPGQHVVLLPQRIAEAVLQEQLRREQEQHAAELAEKEAEREEQAAALGSGVAGVGVEVSRGLGG